MATFLQSLSFFLFLGLQILCQSSVTYIPWDGTRSGITCNETSIYALEQWIDLGSKVWYIDTNGAEETNDWYSNFDISCSLDSSWGLHPNFTSTLSVTINGTNPSGDLIVSFSENNAKWFSVFLDLETYINNRIYPSCVDNPDDDVVVMCTTSGIAEGNINDVLLEEFVSNRSNLFGGYPYRWLKTFNPWDCALEMPVTITLTNDPESNNFLVNISDDECSASYMYHMYMGDMFVGNQGLDIYLSMNSPYDIPIIIESLVFEYNVREPTMSPTVAPSMSPTITTMVPTTDPTRDPTNDPLAYPTIDATAVPTIAPTILPTVSPTTSPTMSPSEPTAPPTKAQTAEPTINPNIEPTTVTRYITTQQPSITPTGLPSDSPSTTPTNQSTSVPVDPDVMNNTTDPSTGASYNRIIIGLICLFSIMIVLSYIDARCIRGRRNDFYNAGALVYAAFQILDLVSDIFFSLKMWTISAVLYWIRIASVVFIIVPITLSLLQLFMEVQQWRALGKDTLTAWFRNHAFGLYALSLVTGSAFSGIQICRSDMFGLSQFAMPLNENQIVGFQSKKLWTTVLVEVEFFVEFRCVLCLYSNPFLVISNT